ncbi:MAG: LCP family protein, partial [Propionibacteriales bacterium]|nr:LCP family protein [Propionibacteriales bacterium]
YALVDLKGFQDLVDAVGGVTIKIGQPIPIGSVGDITDWIPAGTRHLDGYQTLWYARSRATSDDYSRMARQKCVMNAMLHQLDPTTVVSNFGDIAKAGKQVISTSIPASELSTFVELSLKTRNLPISTVSFVPPRIDTGDPDWSLIRSMVSDAIDASQARDAASSGQSARNKTRSGAGRPAKTKPDKDANDSADLAGSC